MDFPFYGLEISLAQTDLSHIKISLPFYRNCFSIIYTSSNERLWECVRCRNFNTDTLNDFLSDFQLLSILLKPTFFHQQPGFCKKIFQWQSPFPSDWRDHDTNYVAWRRQFRKTRLTGLKYLHQLSNFGLNILTLTCNV